MKPPTSHLFIFVTGIGPSESDTSELDRWLADELHGIPADLRQGCGHIWEAYLDDVTAASVFDTIVERSSAYFVLVIRQIPPGPKGEPAHSLFRASPNFTSRRPMPPTKRNYDKDVHWWVTHCDKEIKAEIQELKERIKTEARKRDLS